LFIFYELQLFCYSEQINKQCFGFRFSTSWCGFRQIAESGSIDPGFVGSRSNPDPNWSSTQVLRQIFENYTQYSWILRKIQELIPFTFFLKRIKNNGTMIDTSIFRTHNIMLRWHQLNQWKTERESSPFIGAAEVEGEQLHVLFIMYCRKLFWWINNQCFGFRFSKSWCGFTGKWLNSDL